MNISWTDVAKVVIGPGLGRVLEHKPTIIYCSLPWAAYPCPGSPSVTLHTHAIVMKNVGRKTAVDVRIRHRLRTAVFYLEPNGPSTAPDMPGGGFEIVLPRLVPNEEVTVFYMDPNPFNDNFHGQISHSDGLAVQVSALLKSEYPVWLGGVVELLALLGTITAVYLAVMLVRHVPKWWG